MSGFLVFQPLTVSLGLPQMQDASFRIPAENPTFARKNEREQGRKASDLRVVGIR
jgi:hypothetical protein